MTLELENQYSEFEERVVNINRCAKVVKGGRRFSFSALVVVGNKKGTIGVGVGKAKEVSECIRKATEAAHRNLVEVNVQEGTIAHEIKQKFGATKMFMKPASPGTGVIAGASARAVLELAGVHNILTKTYGSTNPQNVVRAVVDALTSIRDKKAFARLRGQEV
jgi:small subunit ribosomal protein S5